MRVRDLLCMSTGQQSEPPRTSEQPWTKTFLAQPVPFKPGNHFLYNTSATYMLSAIVQKVTGMTVLDYLRPRLFEPLGIEHPTWETSPQGVTAGGYGLSIRTEDIARFGQLYLQKGRWQGRQLVPAAWIETATSRQVSTGRDPNGDWGQGYGYQFWRCRHGAYRGDGAFGQYCIVLPEQDAVIAITSGLKDMQAVLNLVWDKLLPGMKPAPLPADYPAEEKLRGMLKSLSLRPQEGTAAAANVWGRRYVFPANSRKLETITLLLDEKDSAVTLVTRQDGVEQRIKCGCGAWSRGRMAWGSLAAGHHVLMVGGRQRCVDRGWDVHDEALLLRNAVPRHDQAEVLGQGIAMRRGDECGVWANQGTPTGGYCRLNLAQTDGRGSGATLCRTSVWPNAFFSIPVLPWPTSRTPNSSTPREPCSFSAASWPWL